MRFFKDISDVFATPPSLKVSSSMIIALSASLAIPLCAVDFAAMDQCIWPVEMDQCPQPIEWNESMVSSAGRTMLQSLVLSLGLYGLLHVSKVLGYEPLSDDNTVMVNLIGAFGLMANNVPTCITQTCPTDRTGLCF